MNDFITATTELHGAVFTLEEARQLGISPRQLQRAVRTGTCLRIRPGLYAAPEYWPQRPADRHLLVARGVVRQHDYRIALSHHSAAIAQGVATWGVPHAQPRYVRAHGRHTRSGGLQVGRAWPRDAYDFDGKYPVLRPAVAALQIAMTYGIEAGLVTIDSALHQGRTTEAELALWLSRVAGHRHCHRARLAFAAAEGASESPGETRLRHRLGRVGHDHLEPQVDIREDGLLLGRVDLLDVSCGVEIEFDGLVKYSGVDGGQVLAAEKVREDSIRRVGLGFARFTWADLDRPTRLGNRLTQAAAAGRDTQRRLALIGADSRELREHRLSNAS